MDRLLAYAIINSAVCASRYIAKPGWSEWRKDGTYLVDIYINGKRFLPLDGTKEWAEAFCKAFNERIKRFLSECDIYGIKVIAQTGSDQWPGQINKTEPEQMELI